MKTFDAPLITKLLSETAAFYLLVEMDLVTTTVRYTDMDVDWYYEGELYNPVDLSLGEMSSGSGMQVETMSFSIQNVDQQMASHFLNDNQLGRKVTIRFFCLDGNREVISTVQLFRGLIANWKMDELAIEVTLKNELVLWRKKTLRKSRVLCPWAFKGVECAYSGGSSSCNKTYERCKELGNTDNFGGFRWIADMMEKEIQWGPK